MVLKPCVLETTKREGDSRIEEGRSDGKVKIEEPRDTRADDDILKAPEWDVDSFDGLEYYSSSDPASDEQLSSDELEALENYNIVKRQLIDSKGFYLDPERRLRYFYKNISTTSLDRSALWGKTFREYWEEMVRVCLQKHNQDNQDKVCNVEFVEVVRGNYRGGPRSKSYITFLAREKPDGPLVEYQAKCMVTLDRKRHPILCRPTPTPMP
ncbi:PREDICTED: uncharacterized protein LOC104707720 [Camelina sativa]|uniref:Uncharacterized protein LOC104707720 n=1 Tax=Camelina sativa TaxID=90675 RepID=A0ABM0T8E5_CAMSA|nr:PREDICTED: uncharacterized protein LOC104707720 [Camelina sativa]